MHLMLAQYKKLKDHQSYSALTYVCIDLTVI